MGEKIAVSNLYREPNCLYYVKEDENGFLAIYKALLKRGGKKKEKIEE